MFGTIGRFRFKDERMRSREAMMPTLEEWQREVRPQVNGPFFEAVGRSVDRPDEVLVIALAQDEATYRSIPGNPPQEAWYERLSKNFAAEPQWEDIEVEIVTAEGLQPLLADSGRGSSFDAEEFRRAVERSDIETVASFFADDAEYELIDRRHPPKQSQKVQGRQAIARELAAHESPGLSHKVDEWIQSGNTAAYRETCTYPNGDLVSVMTMLTLRDGKIVREVTMQEWDG